MPALMLGIKGYPSLYVVSIFQKFSNINFTLQSELDEAAAAAASTTPAPPPPATSSEEDEERKRSKLINLGGEDDAFCTCLCRMNVTEEMMAEALKLVIQQREGKSAKSGGG